MNNSLVYNTLSLFYSTLNQRRQVCAYNAEVIHPRLDTCKHLQLIKFMFIVSLRPH